jgi:hypothetical protein
MALIGVNGGLIGSERSTNTTIGGGLWTSNEQVLKRRANTWPVSNIDPNFANVSLLLHLDGSNGGTTFTDSSSNNVTMTRVGSAALSTSISKYGNASVLYTGDTEGLRTPSSSLFTFGTGDFTIEFWMYFGVGTSPSSTADIFFSIGSQQLELYNFLGNFRVRIPGDWAIYGSTSVSTSQWYHIAFARSGSANRLFVNGTQEGGTWTDSRDYTATQLTFGNDFSGTSGYPGNMDEIRVTKGVARYTANFTAPIAAFPDA